jgi:copper chaperone
METLKFKTNVNCGGCIANITPFMNGEKRITTWSVDTANPQKIMTVETEGMTASEVVDLMKTAGYRAEPFTVC